MSDYLSMRREARIRAIVIGVVLLYAAGCAVSATLTIATL